MRRIAIVMLLSLCVPAPTLASHKTGHGTPSGPAPKTFAADFAPPRDSEFPFDIGGFGGDAKGKPIALNPVILVHGNTEDSTFYEAAENPPTVVNVRQRLLSAGYTRQEVWGVSYNGARCGSQACSTANDVNTPDLFNFIQSVRAYTGSQRVDIVAHSLGVTVVRKTIFRNPQLLDVVEDFVAAAGGNHGTTACRGFETSYYGCDEVAPGTPWLNELNSWNPKGEGDETPGPTRYMTIFDGSGLVDTFYLRTLTFDDSKSPRLSGADNRELPNTAHFTLVRGEVAFNLYLPFLRSNNVVTRTDGGVIQPAETRTAPAAGRSLAATGSRDSALLALVLIALGVLVASAAFHLRHQAQA